MKKILTVLLVLFGAGLAWAQQSDPWWRPLSPFGQSEGVTYGNTPHPLPPNGEVMVDMDGGTDGGPLLQLFDAVNGTWDAMGPGAAGVGMTDDTIPVWDAITGLFEDSLLSDDETNITLASGQLLVPDGAIGAPVIAQSGTPTTGWYWISNDFIYAVGGVNQAVITGGGNIRGLANAAGDPTFATISDTNSGLYSIGADNMGMSVGGVLVQDWEDTNAAGAGADLATISSTLGIMDDNTDIFRGMFVDLTNAIHTAAVTAPFVYGMDVDDIVASLATEYAVHLDATGWDVALYVEGTVEDIDHGITAAVQFSPTLEANDNASDQRNALLIDVDMPNGSAGLVNGINIDSVTDDIQTIDSAIMIEGGWDSAITIFDAGHAFTSNPLTGSVYITLDDSTDYSGAGGVDCWLVLRDAGGNDHQIVEVVLNGACP